MADTETVEDVLNILVEADVLYTALVAGVIPTRAIGEAGPVDREEVAPNDSGDLPIPVDCVAVELTRSC